MPFYLYAMWNFGFVFAVRAKINALPRAYFSFMNFKKMVNIICRVDTLVALLHR